MSEGFFKITLKEFNMSVLDKAKIKLLAINEAIDSIDENIKNLQSEKLKYCEDAEKLSNFCKTYNELSNDDQVEEFKPPVDFFARIKHYVVQPNTTVPEQNEFLKIHEIIDLVYDYLKECAPKNSNELVAYLEHSGKGLKGVDKATYVSAILSKSDKFVARRKHGGWFLAEQDPEAHKDESPTIGVVGDSIFNQTP